MHNVHWLIGKLVLVPVYVQHEYWCSHCFDTVHRIINAKEIQHVAFYYHNINSEICDLINMKNLSVK